MREIENHHVHNFCDKPPIHDSHLNLATLGGAGISAFPPAERASHDAHLPGLALFDPLMETAGKLSREAELISRGVIGGALKEAEKDPGGTAVKAATVIGVGAVLGVAASAASPLIAGTAVAAGVAGTGAWLWSTFNTLDKHNVARNAAVAHAVSETWTSKDRAALDRNVHSVESSVGKDALDLGLGLLSGASAGGAARFAPRLICREAPSLGFKFFSQSAIERAFPARVKEFEIADAHKLQVPADGPVQVGVREILGYDAAGKPRTGPERSLLIGHNAELRDAASLPSTDLVATCRPELLEPMMRVRSVLQHASDVEMQVDVAARRLRFLCVDKNQHVDNVGRIILGDRGEYSLPNFLKSLQTNRAVRADLPEATLDAVDKHDLSDISRSFADLPYHVSGLRGVGVESMVFDLAGDAHSSLLIDGEHIDPSNAVLKFSRPWAVPLAEEMGTRPFDAKRFGDFEHRPFSEYVAYLQEKAEPVSLDEIEERHWNEFQAYLDRAGLVFRDPGSLGQLGYKDGKLVVLDWFSIVDPWYVRPE
jgi:hypothetical protein